MVFWFSLSLGMALGIGLIVALAAMHRAELRARCAFYRTLGYGVDMTAPLIGQSGPISGHLAMIRKSSIVAPPGIEVARDTPPGRRDVPRRAFQYTHALNGVRPDSERSAMAARRTTPRDGHDLS